MELFLFYLCVCVCVGIVCYKVINKSIYNCLVSDVCVFVYLYPPPPQRVQEDLRFDWILYGPIKLADSIYYISCTITLFADSVDYVNTVSLASG